MTAESRGGSLQTGTRGPKPRTRRPAIQLKMQEIPVPSRYRLLRHVGGGGQGQVYLALDLHRGNAQVALKVLRAGPGSSVETERFEEEFLLLSRLAHPHIARVRDFGRLAGGGTYFTSDFVFGGNLLSWAEREEARERWRALAGLAAEGLSVLRYLALRSISHGDVKPTNLLVERRRGGPEGAVRLKVVDFGAARARGAAGELWGTGPYLPPPEMLVAASSDRGAAERADLWGLGVALFHAGVGRLPFALGDPAERSAWWARGGGARPREFDPEAPAALDELIARLTAADPAVGFRSAAEALEFLRRRVRLPGGATAAGRVDTWTSSRERFVSDLLETLRGPRGPRRIHAVVGPAGNGKTRALEVLAARLQVEGFRVFSFAGPSDPRPLSEIRAALRASGLSGGPARGDAADLVARLRPLEVAVIVDDAPADPQGAGLAVAALPFLREWARGQRASASAAASSVTVAAGRDPGEIARSLGVSAADLEVHPLETLGTDDIAELAREHFGVEAVPEELVRRLERETGGLSRTVAERLERWTRAGVSADAFGRLEIPERLPAATTAEAEGLPGTAELDPVSKHALGLFKIAGEPLGPEGCAARFPSWSVEEWHGALEALRVSGFLHSEPGLRGVRYRLGGRALSAELSSLLPPEEIRRAREELSRHFREAGDLRSPDAELAFARNELELGNAERGARAALRAARSLLRAGRDAEALEAVRASLVRLEGSGSQSAGSERTRLELALRLRAAELALGNHRAREALDSVPGSLGGAAWYRTLAAKLRAGAYETLGDLSSAARELEPFAGALDELREEPPARAPFRWEAAALLAPLCFRAGRTAEGRACLAAGRRLLDEPAARFGENAPFWARTLAGFARAESSHGDPEIAKALLERSLELSRGLLRGEFFLGALNELGILLARARRREEALRAFEEVEERSRAAGATVGAVKAIFNRAVILYRSGELARAEELFREARRLSDSVGLRALSASLWIGHAAVLRERGRNIEALRLYRRVVGLGDGVDPADRIVAHNNLSELYLALGSLRRAALHAALAYRAARKIEDRFRIAFTLRLRGLVRWALGNLEGARADLGRAAALARAEADLRGEGIALYYSGLVEARAGRHGEALRRFRSAMAASRRAGDPKHLLAARAAALSELLALGRSAAARRILCRPESSGAGGAVERTLRFRAAGDWPRELPSALACARESLARGNLWDAFSALVSLRDDRSLNARARREIALEIVPLAQRLLRRLPPRRAARFHESWRLGETPGEGAAETAAPGRAGEPEPDPPSRAELLALLEALRREFALEVAWIWEEPRALPRLRAIAGDPGRAAPLLAERAAAFERAKASGRMVRARPAVFAPLPGTRGPRILCAAATAQGWDLLSKGIQRFGDRRTAIALCARLCESEDELRREKERHASVRSELHRLHVLAATDRHEMETAIATQRVELVEIKRRLAAGERPPATYRKLVAESPALRKIVSRLPVLAESDLPVLLIGESGVGKDFFARTIHDLSRRSDRPFLAEICDVPESLIESELFGSTRGAFTGSVRDRPGIFERAEGGTIYLDEIADLTPGVQARLLRVLEEKRVRPLGAEEPVEVDFRLISSSRKALRELEDPRAIRRDFLYRVRSEVVEIPPLREHPEDVRPLVAAIVDELSRRHAMPVPYLRDDALRILESHPWPGNVRELENVLERALVTRPPEITPELLGLAETEPRAARAPSPRRAGFRTERRRWERQIVLDALLEHGGNATRAAQALGITRRYLGRLLARHGIALSACKGKGKGKGGARPKPRRRRERPPQAPGTRSGPKKKSRKK